MQLAVPTLKRAPSLPLRQVREEEASIVVGARQRGLRLFMPFARPPRRVAHWLSAGATWSIGKPGHVRLRVSRVVHYGRVLDRAIHHPDAESPAGQAHADRVPSRRREHSAANPGGFPRMQLQRDATASVSDPPPLQLSHVERIPVQSPAAVQTSVGPPRGRGHDDNQCSQQDRPENQQCRPSVASPEPTPGTPRCTDPNRSHSPATPRSSILVHGLLPPSRQTDTHTSPANQTST